MSLALHDRDYQHIVSIGSEILECRSMHELMDASMQRIKGVIPAKCMMFLLASSPSWRLEETRTIGIDDDYPTLHHSHFHEDPGRPYLIENWRLGRPKVMNSSLIWPVGFEPRDRFYRTLLKPRDLRHSMVISIPIDSHLFGSLVMLRSSGAGPFTHRDETFAETITPFLKGAVDRAYAHEKNRRLDWLLSEIGRDLPYQDFIILDRQLALIRGLPTSSKFLQDVIRDIQRPSGQKPTIAPDLRPICLKLLEAENKRHVKVTISFSDAKRWGLQLSLEIRKLTYGQDSALSLHICRANDAIDAAATFDHYNLTQQESLIAREASLGLTNAEIAKRLAISPSTVANHLSSALAKTGLKARWQMMRKSNLAQKIAALPLTKRERQILQARASGLPTPALAAKFNIGEVTVRNHLRSIYRKLGVSGFRGVMAYLEAMDTGPN